MNSKIVFFIFLFIIDRYNSQIQIEIQSIQNPQSYIQLKIINNTDQKIIIYDSFLLSYYNIKKKDSDQIIALESYSNGNDLDYGNYQSNFSKKMIEDTQIKYNISYEDAVYFLENKKTSIIVGSNATKHISLRVFNRAYKPSGPIEMASYYLSGKIVFTNDYFPKMFLECLEKEGFKILNEIEIPNTEIDINKFFITDIK